MRKLLIGFLVFFFTLPAFASVDHWTCSNDQTVLYFILDTDAGNFMMFDDKGTFLAAAKFTSQEKSKDGTPYLYAEVTEDVAVGVAKVGEGAIVLAIVNGKETVKFHCN